MFQPYWATFRPYYKNRFKHFQYILGSKIVYIGGMMLQLQYYTTFVNSLGSQNVLEVLEPVLIVRPDDGPLGPKHVALYVLSMVIIDVLDENTNTLFK
jgi:hypothetical protein